jgi:hypothetical protein
MVECATISDINMGAVRMYELTVTIIPYYRKLDLLWKWNFQKYANGTVVVTKDRSFKTCILA